MTRQYSDEALRSFFGARKGGKERPQDVFTPQVILDAIERVWPEGIECDPAPNPNALVVAQRYRYPDDGMMREPASGEWPDRTYCNPPYRDLKMWLKKPVRYREHMMLIPVRPLRVWWCEHVARSTQVAWLKPVAFVGHKQAYPAPLCMVYYGNRVIEFRAEFKSVATHINRFE